MSDFKQLSPQDSWESKWNFSQDEKIFVDWRLERKKYVFCGGRF